MFTKNLVVLTVVVASLGLGCASRHSSDAGPDAAGDASPDVARDTTTGDSSVDAAPDSSDDGGETADAPPGGPGHSCEAYCTCACAEMGALCSDGDMDQCLAYCGYDRAAFCQPEDLPALGDCGTCDNCNSPSVCM